MVLGIYLWYYGTKALQYYDTLVLWYSGTTVLLYCVQSTSVPVSAQVAGKDFNPIAKHEGRAHEQCSCQEGMLKKMDITNNPFQEEEAKGLYSIGNQGIQSQHEEEGKREETQAEQPD